MDIRSVVTSKWREQWRRPGQAGKAGQSGRLPQLLVDVSVIIRNDAQTGIQRVVRAVWTNLLEQSGTNFAVVPVYATRTQSYRYARPDFLSQPVAERRQGAPVKVQVGDRFLGLDLSAHLLPSRKRQLRSWRKNGLTIHLVVYDLLPLQRPAWFTEKAVARFKRWFDVLADNCDQALCISDQVASDLRERISNTADAPEIKRLRLAGDISGSQPSYGIDEETAKAIAHAQRRPTLIMVGTIEPRKGYEAALAAFELLWTMSGDTAPNLIIAGRPGWRTEALQEKLNTHPEKGHRLYWLSNVSDEGLAALYEASRGVLHASYAEGFGLPAIEAAMHKRHALVRDLPVFREQNLRNLIYFQSDDPAHLAAKISILAEAGAAPEVSLPTWSDCVRDLLGEIGITSPLSVSAPQEMHFAP